PREPEEPAPAAVEERVVPVKPLFRGFARFRENLLEPDDPIERRRVAPAPAEGEGPQDVPRPSLARLRVAGEQRRPPPRSRRPSTEPTPSGGAPGVGREPPARRPARAPPPACRPRTARRRRPGRHGGGRGPRRCWTRSRPRAPLRGRPP